jgi:hypothetical protein
MRVRCGRFVISFFVVSGGFLVVPGGVFVMLGRFMMMFYCPFGHTSSLSPIA